jgi:hypothetical protein
MREFDFVFEIDARPYTIVAMRDWLAQRDACLGGCTFQARYDRARITFEKLSDALDFDLTWLEAADVEQAARTARPEPSILAQAF